MALTLSRSRLPFFTNWRLNSAVQAWGKSAIYFRNVHPPQIDEFSEEYLALNDGSFSESPLPENQNEPFPLGQGLDPLAGGFSGQLPYAIAPIQDLYLSEFSVQYLGLFLLSSLVRYRPQTWMHAISRSVIPGEPADDKALSLIERFLDLNAQEVPDMIVKILNPHEDYTFF